MRVTRRVAAVLVVALAAALAGCAPALPSTVVPGTSITAGWDGKLTSTNAAASPTPGNLDIAVVTRAGFGSVVDGEFVADESFGTVKIIRDEPFTVRYDLAEPQWSDGIPLDAADLVLGWAGGTGLLDDTATATPSAGAVATSKITKVDEFARTIDVQFADRTGQWQTQVPVPVPAHVVGKRAFGVSDPMEAKEAVIRAVRRDDAAALAKIAKVWLDGFDVGRLASAPADLLLSSGPFRVDPAGVKTGVGVALVPNGDYRGAVTPKVARVELLAPGLDPVSELGERFDAVQVAPTPGNRDPIHELERRDVSVDATHDGTLWSVLLQPHGVFTDRAARVAFIHAIPASDLRDGGAGEWASEYVDTTAMTTAPGSRAYDIVAEDSGFATSLGTAADDVALERDRSGVKPGTPVCVLYDRGSEFAAGVFAAMQKTAGEAGWGIVDCGSDDYDAALAAAGWDAAIARTPIPQTPADIARQWGSDGVLSSLLGLADEARDQGIVQLEQTTDVYRAREIRGEIEATIVQSAVALPLAANPRLTIVDRGYEGITGRDGVLAPLTSSMVQWAVAKQ